MCTTLPFAGWRVPHRSQCAHAIVRHPHARAAQQRMQASSGCGRCDRRVAHAQPSHVLPLSHSDADTPPSSVWVDSRPAMHRVRCRQMLVRG